MLPCLCVPLYLSRSWLSNCSGTYLCTSLFEYYAYTSPQFLCPPMANSTATAPTEVCSAVNGSSCSYMTEVPPTCVSWFPTCGYEYSCATMAEYTTAVSTNSTNATTNCLFPVTNYPPPIGTCVPMNGSCGWHVPCYMWRQHCSSDYVCGTVDQYAAFYYGPQPICIGNSTENVPAPGVCLYQNGQCKWSGRFLYSVLRYRTVWELDISGLLLSTLSPLSFPPLHPCSLGSPLPILPECRSWLNSCRTSWQCGSDYEYRVYQSFSFPQSSCPEYSPFFMPPTEPGVCEFNMEKYQCVFRGPRKFSDVTHTMYSRSLNKRCFKNSSSNTIWMVIKECVEMVFEE